LWKVGFCGDGWKVLILRGLRAGPGVLGEVEEDLAVGEECGLVNVGGCLDQFVAAVVVPAMAPVKARAVPKSKTREILELALRIGWRDPSVAIVSEGLGTQDVLRPNCNLDQRTNSERTRNGLSIRSGTRDGDNRRHRNCRASDSRVRLQGRPRLRGDLSAGRLHHLGVKTRRTTDEADRAASIATSRGGLCPPSG